MKKLVILFTLFLSEAHAQGEKRRFELGSTLLTINSLSSKYYSAPDRPAFEIVNGILFRYHAGRRSYRAHMSYSDHAADFASPPQQPDASGGHINNKDFRIGGGVQYDLYKTKDWLYCVFDLSYRNVYSSGTYYGGITGANDRFLRTGNGADAMAGLGFRIKPVANLCISPELGYFASYTMNSKSFTSLTTGQGSTFYYQETNVHLQLRLQLLARF